MADQIGIGIIGTGNMTKHTTRSLLAQDSRLVVRAVCDPDPRSIAWIQAELPQPADVVDDYRDLVRRPDIDWVKIGSWNCFHAEQTIAAFEAGKNVFCQKPLATNIEDGLAMRRAWRASGRRFAIGFTLRYSPHYRAIRRLLDEGAIGSLVSLEFNETLGFNHGGYIMGDWRRLRKNAGTHLLEKCCHDIDLVNWFVGSRASKAASFGGLGFFRPEHAHHIQRLGHDANGIEAYRTWGGLINLNPFTSDKDIVDNQVAIVAYQNGVRASFHTNCNSAIPERRIVLQGTEGTIRADVVPGTIEVARIGFDEEIKKVEACASGGHGGGDEILARELADCILKAAQPAAGLEEGLESAVTCFGLDAAMDQNCVFDYTPLWRMVDAQ